MEHSPGIVEEISLSAVEKTRRGSVSRETFWGVFVMQRQRFT
jgi:hypothetical protein